MAKSSMLRPSSIPDLRLDRLAINPNDGVYSPVPQNTTPVLHLANLHEQPDAPILHACAPSLVAPDYAPPGKAVYATLRTDRPLPRLKTSAKRWPFAPIFQQTIEHLTTVEVRQRAPGVAMPGSQEARDQGLYRAAMDHPRPSKALCDQAGLRPRQ